MTTNIAVLLAFFLGILFQNSFIQSLNGHLSFIPIMLIIGIIVLHRAGPIHGALWFTLMAFVAWMTPTLFGWGIVYLALAIIGPILMLRVFTHRSIYALAGLGLSLYSVFGLIHMLFHPLYQVSYFFSGYLFLLTGLYIGFLVSKYTEDLIKRSLYVRKRSV